MTRNRLWIARPTLGALLAVVLSVPALAGGNFRKSDDYKDGEEDVKVLLQDDDHGKMIDDERELLAVMPITRLERETPCARWGDAAASTDCSRWTGPATGCNERG